MRAVLFPFLLLLAFLSPSVAGREQGCPDTCDLRECPLVLAADCDGTIMKDECQCCPVCQPNLPPDSYDPFYEDVEDGVMTQNYVNASHKELCAQITCTRLQTCTVNIQGIPICRCPSAIYCRQQLLRRRSSGSGGGSPEVCAMDGNTYRSRCFLRMKECTENNRIKVKYDGRCLENGGKRRGGGGGGVGRRKNHNDEEDDEDDHDMGLGLTSKKNQNSNKKDIVSRKQQRKDDKLKERHLRQQQKREKRREEKKTQKRLERLEKKEMRREEKEVERRAPSRVEKKRPASKLSRKRKARRRLHRRSNANNRNRKMKKFRGKRSFIISSDLEHDIVKA